MIIVILILFENLMIVGLKKVDSRCEELNQTFLEF